MAFACIIPGITVGVIGRRVTAKWGHTARRTFAAAAFAAALVLFLLLNIIWTTRDFFYVWPAQAETRWWMQTGLKEVADAVEADPRLDSVAVCAPSYLVDETIEWWRPAWLVYHYLSPRTEALLRWYDCTQASVIPAGDLAHLAFPDAISLDQVQAFPVARWLHPSNIKSTVISGQSLIVSANLMPDWSAHVTRLASDAPIAWPPEAHSAQPAVLPVDFGHAVQLTAYDVQGQLEPGAVMTVTTYWRVTAPLDPRLALFTHVLTGTRIVAQNDRLGITSARLQPGDGFAQTHVIELPDNIEKGWYQLAIGLYSRDTGVRLQVYEGAQSVADRLFLSPVRIKGH